jgi:hypothetical protein
MVGKPMLKGTRITVELILERLGDDRSGAEILASFPHRGRRGFALREPMPQPRWRSIRSSSWTMTLHESSDG